MLSHEQKKQIETTFNAVATRYDTNHFFLVSAQNLINCVDFEGAKRMLDVSTGTGTVAIHAAEKFPDLTIDAIDISTEMLHQAQKKAQGKNLKKIRFLKNDAEQLKYEDSTFDVITCGYGLFFFPEITHTFKELYKTLKPNGKLAFSSFTTNAFTPFEKMFAELLKEYKVEMPKLSKTKLKTNEQIYDLCQEVSAENISITSHKIRYKIGINDWWSLLNSAGYKGLLNQIDTDKINEFKEKHLNQIAELSEQGKILLKADSLYTVVSKQVF